MLTEQSRRSVLKMDDRQRQKYEREKSYDYFMRHYGREKRYLVLFSRDFQSFLSSEEWLRTDEARGVQKFYDFLCAFESLREKMKEFRWSKEFLAENGIDFIKAKKLYFALV